jgi:hypothetical protein
MNEWENKRVLSKGILNVQKNLLHCQIFVLCRLEILFSEKIIKKQCICQHCYQTILMSYVTNSL